METALILNAVDSKRQSLGVEALNDAERVLTLISYARFEVENGGFSQFYVNQAGDYAEETLWAFDQIGASECTDLFRRANSIFPGGSPPRAADARRTLLQEDLALIASDIFEALDDEYAQIGGDVDALLDAFIVQRRDSLPTPPAV